MIFFCIFMRIEYVKDKYDYLHPTCIHALCNSVTLSFPILRDKRSLQGRDLRYKKVERFNIWESKTYSLYLLKVNTNTTPVYLNYRVYFYYNQCPILGELLSLLVARGPLNIRVLDVTSTRVVIVWHRPWHDHCEFLHDTRHLLEDCRSIEGEPCGRSEIINVS